MVPLLEEHSFSTFKEVEHSKRLCSYKKKKRKTERKEPQITPLNLLPILNYARISKTLRRNSNRSYHLSNSRIVLYFIFILPGNYLKTTSSMALGQASACSGLVNLDNLHSGQACLCPFSRVARVTL